MEERKKNGKKLPKKAKAHQLSKIWVNPNFTLNGPHGNRAWDYRQPSTSAQLLELGDIALGSPQSSPLTKERKAAA